jgi:hypothetical protein
MFDAFAPASASPAPGPRNGAEARTLESIGELAGITRDDMDRGRRLLTLLGDAGRRTVLEQLSRRPDKPGHRLPNITGMDHADLYHRLRSLTYCGVIAKNRHHVYSVDPGVLTSASRYADLLTLAASLTARNLPR